MKNFINWLVVSSNNPDQVALTVKGALLAVIPTFLLVAQLAHFNWSYDQLSQIVQQVTVIISSGLVFVGLIRKIILTISGQSNYNVTPPTQG